jgi:glutamate-5-semialdehyde dehydrogenase
MILSNSQKNAVLDSMAKILEQERDAIIAANQKDIRAFAGNDKALFDRLKADEKKVEGMVKSIKEVLEKEDPIGKEIYQFRHENGMKVVNRTAPFGTILIIYESRPDVTIEAASIAFKSGNKILLKGGKEAIHSNLKLVECWHQALAQNGISSDWIEYLDYNREKTQAFLKNPSQRVDLIVPRGGERLINFVKTHANCPVLVSGRGNNFLYVHPSADLDKAEAIIKNGKLSKISACNALDKILIDKNLPNYEDFVQQIIRDLKSSEVEIYVEKGLDNSNNGVILIDDNQIWYEEFLDYKIAIGIAENMTEAIQKINEFCGGHSVTILAENDSSATDFMQSIDAAAVYHNASTRFTDGGQFGMGAELAISTDKIHHRGPLGLDQLVTNKWFIYGNGQTR